MKLVIDIPEYMFEDIQDRYRHPNKGNGINLLEYAVAKGIPLPKGHGRLIDADELLKQSYCIDDSATLSTRDVVNVEEIDDASTIIEADKEQEDGRE